MAKTLSRRHILNGIVSAPVLAGLSPFLPSGMVRAADPPKRLLTIFHPMGYLESTFWPTADGDSFKLDPTMAALDPWKSKLIFPDGIVLLAGPGGGNEHGGGMGGVFTGSKFGTTPTGAGMPTTASYDYLIAEHLYGLEKTPHKYLALGANAINNDFGGDHCFFSGFGKFFVKDNQPASVFDTVFSRFTASGMVDQSALLRLKAEKKSVIDAVKADLDRICRKVGAQEKAKCDAHLESIRSMERNLSEPGNEMVCTKPNRPSGGQLTQTLAGQFDMIAAAFACDQTRVISLTIGQCNGGVEFVPGIGQHDTTHAVGDSPNDPVPVANHKKIDQYIATQWATLFKKLDSYKEGNGTLLYNTLIVMGSDTTTALNATNRGAHQHRRMTYLLAGGSNFAFKTGRHLKLSAPNDRVKTTQHRLLTSISNAFGRNVDKVGDYDPSSGPLPGLL